MRLRQLLGTTATDWTVDRFIDRCFCQVGLSLKSNLFKIESIMQQIGVLLLKVIYEEVAMDRL